MKTIRSIFSVVLLSALAACSTPKETPAKEPEPAPRVSKTDRMRGGTSFSNPVVIRVTSERAGLDEEYKWLSKNYPGYSLIRRRQTTSESKHFDIVRIRTRNGQLKDVYFDSTAFARKN